MARKTLGSILALMKALGMFVGGSWDAWIVVLKAAFAIPMTEAELAVFQRISGRQRPPAQPVRELWLIIGRRGGKSLVTALMLVYQATCRTFKLAAGEVGVIACFAADRRQGRVVKGYVSAMLRAIGALEEMVSNETSESITLKNGLRIEIFTSNFRTLRGYTIVGAVLDEIAFWPVDDSANPDSEIVNALRPAMATVENAMLVGISSPYARRGELWRAYQKHFGQDDSPVLVVCADTRTMNPEVPQAIVDQAFEDDPAHAIAEYGQDGRVSFRTDIESFVNIEAVMACVVPGRFEIPPQRGITYRGFTDPAGGSGGDSMTLAIGHAFAGRIVIDALREAKPPFSPDEVVQEFSDLLHTYRVSQIFGDRWGGLWPAERLQKRGISYRVIDQVKSDLYQALLPRLNAGTIELLDHERCRKQLLALERRTSRGGKDSIDHQAGGRDDVINSVAGCAYLLRSGTATIATIDVEEVNAANAARAMTRAAEIGALVWQVKNA